MLPISLPAALFLISGIINPVGESNIDNYIGFFVFGFTAYTVIRGKILLTLIVMFSFFLSSIFLDNFSANILGTLSGLVLAFSLAKLKILKRTAIFVLIFSFLVSSWVISDDLREILTSDLSKFVYNNDQGAFLKTYYYLEHGTNYYEAFKSSMTGKFTNPPLPQDIWSWRIPTIFVIWQIFPGDSSLNIFVLYLIMSSLVVYTAFLIGKRYLDFPISILPAYIVIPYLHFGARDLTFLLTEWWGVFTFMIAIYFLVTKRIFFSIIFLSLTVLIRELFILPIGLMFLFTLFKYKRVLSVFVIPLVSFIALFSFHLMWTSKYIDAVGSIYSPRIVSDGFFFIQQTLTFASGEYLLFRYRPFLFFLLTAIIGCWYVYGKFSKGEAIILVMAFLSFPIFFLKFGSTPYNDYWGIFYMPFVLILAPLSLGLLVKKKS